MSTPDFTAAQFVAVVGAVIAVAVAFGLSLDDAQKGSILGLAAIVGSVLVYADMKIRKHRAENLSAIKGSSPTP